MKMILEYLKIYVSQYSFFLNGDYYLGLFSKYFSVEGFIIGFIFVLLVYFSSAEEQKKAFHNIVEIYAGLPQEQQFGITVWGISDKNTWIREKKKRLEWPLLFDDNYDKKPAYVGIMECFRNLK